MNKETWFPILNFEGVYEISNQGRIKSLPRTVFYGNGMTRNLQGKILKPINAGKGYLAIQLTNKSGVLERFYMHRLVASHFIRNDDELPEVNHKNGNKRDNRVDNLEWVSVSDNKKHAYRTGLNNNVGENSHYSKYSDSIILQVRELFETGNYTQRELANKFKISPMQIHRIVKYKNRRIIYGKEVVNK